MPMPPLTHVNSQYGAPMGRRDTHDDREFAGKVMLQRVPFVDGAYDRGGAYWGSPANLWRCYALIWMDDIKTDWHVDFFLRANSREEAKRKVREEYPNARFYR